MTGAGAVSHFVASCKSERCAPFRPISETCNDFEAGNGMAGIFFWQVAVCLFESEQAGININQKQALNQSNELVRDYKYT